MSFLVSRASSFAVLLSVPLVQALACSSPDRNFGTADATGGTSSGGAGKGGTLNQGGKAGSATGTGGDVQAGTGPGGEPGTAGSGAEAGEANVNAGAGGEAGAGGTLSGGTGGAVGKGGSAGAQGTAGSGGSGGTGGAPGTGGVGGILGTGGVNTGGANSGGAAGKGGSGGTGGACTATGAEICTDGKDNDCNGHVDCLTFSSVFPDLNGAAAGKDVVLQANAPSITGYTFQCRSARGGAVADNVAWAACQTGANLRIVPRTVAESQAAASDGLWTTQVRALFPNGSTSDPFSHTYYMHSSLHSATRCSPRATDQAFITAGRGYLNDAGVFGTATVLRSPFIQLGFTPPVSTRFNVVAGNGVVKVASLRRRFTRSTDDKYLLITRNYSSSRSNVCDALDLRTHDSRTPGLNNNNQYLDDCNVVVLNKTGSGICLYVDANNVIQAIKHNNAYTPSPSYSPTADNFAWRKFLDRNSKRDGLVHFSPKCFVAGCTTTQPNTFYLPDRTQFPYF